MASKYFVGNGTNWSSTSSWSTSSGGSSGAAVPAAGDDVILNSSSPGNLTIDASTNTIRSIVMTGFTNTVTHSAAVTLNIGGATAPVSNIALVFAGTYTISNATTSAISIVDTSAATNTYNFNGATLGNLTIDNGTTTATELTTSGYSQGATAATTLTQGKFNTNGLSVTIGLFSSSNSNTRALTLGASTVTVTGTGTAWNMATVANMTLSAASSTITCNGAAVTFSGGPSITYGTVNLTGSGVATVVGASASFGTLNRTSTAVTTDSFSINGAKTVTGTLTLAGNSITNRLLVQSSVLGTPITITNTGATMTWSNVDFQDIALGTAYNASAITGGCGNCLGNSNITFTTAQTNYWVGGASTTWAALANWANSSGGTASSGRVPLPQDTIQFDSHSVTGTVTITNAGSPRIGFNFDTTGNTHTINFTITGTIYGYLNFTGNESWGASGGTETFSARSSVNITNYVANSGTASSVVFNGPGGTWTLQSNFASNSLTNNIYTLANGTLNTNGYSMYSNSIIIDAGTSLIMGASTLFFHGTGPFWNAAASTVTADTSTIEVNSVSTTARTFEGAGQTYNNLTVASGPASSFAITGANTFKTLSVPSDSILTMPASTTNTFTDFNVNGVNNGYLALPGVVGNWITTPMTSALQITGDIDICALVAMTTWTVATQQCLVVAESDTSHRQYRFEIVGGTNKLDLMLSNDGLTQNIGTSTVGTGFANGSINWVRATWKQSTGVVTFYTSAGAGTPSWVQLGSTTTIAIASIATISTELEIGSRDAGASFNMIGNVYRAQVYNGIAGTLELDANFATKPFGANSFTESSSNAATVTINGALAQVGDGRVSLVSSTIGTQATLSSSTQQSCNYLSIQDSKATGAGWYAGANSINISDNTGWFFSGGTNFLPLTGAGT